MKSYFINEAMETAIKSYLESNEKENSILYNSFLVVVIRTLNVIYDKLDIISPYKNNNFQLFKENILKYGYNEKELEIFFNEMMIFFDNEKNNVVPNDTFIVIEKKLIDMFMCKKINYNVSELELREFKKLLYSPKAGNELIISYNFMNSKDEKEILNYFEMKNNLIKKEEDDTPKKLLSPDAYKVINKNYTDIALLTAEDVDKINDQVYFKLDVNKNAVNFEYMFEKALEKFYNRKDDSITSGNGYVDILLILGIIVTLVMVILIVTIIVG